MDLGITFRTSLIVCRYKNNNWWKIHRIRMDSLLSLAGWVSMKLQCVPKMSTWISSRTTLIIIYERHVLYPCGSRRITLHFLFLLFLLLFLFLAIMILWHAICKQNRTTKTNGWNEMQKRNASLHSLIYWNDKLHVWNGEKSFFLFV